MTIHRAGHAADIPPLEWGRASLVVSSVAILVWLVSSSDSPAYDIHFDYTSFDNPNSPGADPHFGQAQFNVLNYPSINGNYMMTSTDNHRPEMVANGNALAEFYNNFLADYNTQYRGSGLDAVAEADAINAYTVNNSTKNGPRPTWLILNEISASVWPDSTQKGADYRKWVIDVVTRLRDTYGYNVVTYSPFANPSSTYAIDWRALAEKSYIGVENYLSGAEVMANGTDYASRVAWAQAQYEWSQTKFSSLGVSTSRLFLGEHFGNTAAGVGWGRAGISAADWDTVIQIRQDAIYNADYAGFLAYSWGGNKMFITEAEQIQHEYYYRSRRVLHSQKPQWLADNAINVNGTTIPLSWGQPLNWLGGVPTAPGAEVNFWRTLTANRTITLDGIRTVGKMSFDSPISYTLTAGSGGALQFNNSGTPATLTSNQGNHTITAGVQLTNTLNAAIHAGTFTINGVIGGTGGITKSGPGTLVLTAVNGYTGHTTVQAGTLRITNRFFADSANVLLATGGTLDLQFSGSPDTIRSLLIDNVPQVIGLWGAIGNSAATYHTSLITGSGVLQVVAGPVIGDYNNDGKVDSADYVVWRRKIGATTLTNRDPNNTGAVGQADYVAWRAHFGQTAVNASGLGDNLASGNESAIPEPSTALFASFFAIIALSRRHRRPMRVLVPRT
jgi:autotransporter-associated beta strand protein